MQRIIATCNLALTATCNWTQHCSIQLSTDSNMQHNTSLNHATEHIIANLQQTCCDSFGERWEVTRVVLNCLLQIYKVGSDWCCWRHGWKQVDQNNSRQIRPSEKEERRQEIEASTNRHGTTRTGSGVGSLVGPGDGSTVTTSSYTTLMHSIYSNHTLYYLASLTRRVGDSRVHRLLPTQQALYTPWTHWVGWTSYFYSWTCARSAQCDCCAFRKPTSSRHFLRYYEQGSIYVISMIL